MEALEDGSNGQWAAGQLLLAADKYGMFPKDLIRFPHILKTFGLQPKDLTSEVLRIAALEDRRHSESIVEAVSVINTMGALTVLETKWKASGLETLDEYLATVRPKPVPKLVSDPGVPVGRDKPNKLPSTKEGGTTRPNIFGHPVTAVLRWMGQEGFDAAQAAKALRRYGVEASPVTIGIQLKAGKTGDRGSPANITDDQANEIYEKISK